MARRLVLSLAVLSLAASAVSAQADDPYGVHVGLSEDGGSLVLQWFSRTAGPSVVEVDGETYEGGSAPLPHGAGVVHTVPLSGLAPGPHPYALPDGTEGEIRVPPVGGPARLAFLGDHGTNELSAATVGRLVAEAPDAVFHAGDVSYAHGNPAGWDGWFAIAEPVAASVPWLPALGNHETYFVAPTGALGDVVPEFRDVPNPEVDAFRARFALPGNELWWSWDVGPVHVVALDTFYSLLAEGTPQHAWLAQDLAENVDAPWTVVYLHEPPWSSNSHGSSLRVQTGLVPLAETLGVDLVVAGHDHGYERSWPLVAGAPVAATQPYVHGAGVTYVVSGGGGEGLYDEWEEPQPAWSAARRAEYHVLVVDATPDALRLRAVAHDGSVFDEFSIVKPAAEDGPPATTPAAPTPAAAAVAAVAVLVAAALARRR